jgi:hypothetical protein
MGGSSIIGSRTGGISEVMDDFGMPSFESGNVEELSSSLLEWERATSREDLKTKGRRYFGYEAIGKQLAEIYARGN